MKVITLDSRAFGNKCRDLRALAEADGFHPELVVGIATGGVYVAAEAFGEGGFVVVSKTRKSTETKKSLRLHRLFRLLPMFLLDRLRVAEHYARLWRRDGTADRENAFVLPPDVAERVRSSSRILVMDDAVDTGHTLFDVVAKIRECNLAADTRLAAIVVTQPDPAVLPDYCLFDQVLVRFPWSMDMKKAA